MSQDDMPAVIKDEFLAMHNKEFIDALKYLLTEPNTEYSFIVKQLNDENKIVTEKRVKAGEELDESELNLLVGVMINEFKEQDLNPSADFNELRQAVETVLDNLEEPE